MAIFTNQLNLEVLDLRPESNNFHKESVDGDVGRSSSVSVTKIICNQSVIVDVALAAWPAVQATVLQRLESVACKQPHSNGTG